MLECWHELGRYLHNAMGRRHGPNSCPSARRIPSTTACPTANGSTHHEHGAANGSTHHEHRTTNRPTHHEHRTANRYSRLGFPGANYGTAFGAHVSLTRKPMKASKLSQYFRSSRSQVVSSPSKSNLRSPIAYGRARSNFLNQQ